MFRIRYAKTIASSAALAVAALLVTLVLTHTGPAKPRPAPRPPTSPPSEVTREAIKPGNYATAINIHNPSLGAAYYIEGQTLPGTVTFWKKAVIAPYEGAPTSAPSAWHQDSLAPDYAMEIDCTNIVQFLNGPSATVTTFTKGFVVILVRRATEAAVEPLDVYGVYTAEPPAVSIPGIQGPPPSPPPSPQTEIPGIALEMLRIPPRSEYFNGINLAGAGQLRGGWYYEYSAKFLCGNTEVSTIP